MNLYNFFWKSSIGKKWLVALTGLVLIGYVLGHLAGNMQFFAGPDKINAYGAFLHGQPLLLWTARLSLIACFVLHIAATIKLSIENRAARPERYQLKRHVQSTIVARTMLWSGLTVLAFVIFHLLHFTSHTVDPTFGKWHDAAGRHDVYRMMVVGFQNPFASGFYAIGVILLSGHLAHGFSSVLQTFGINSKSTMTPITRAARALAVLIAIGYLSIPASVLFAKVGDRYVQDRQSVPDAPVSLQR